MALGYGRVSSNQFACAKFIVDTNGLASGATHTTIAAAISDASSGNEIFVKPGTYTEDLTLKAGVTISGFSGDGIQAVTILGKCTYTSAGTTAIAGIRLKTNSDFFLVVSGSADSIVKLKDCFLDCTNNTGISFTSTGSDTRIYLNYCMGEIFTTGISLFSKTSAGRLELNFCVIENEGLSVTASTISAGIVAYHNCRIVFSTTSTSTGIIQAENSNFSTPASTPQTMITHGGSATNSKISNSEITSGTASAISISSTLVLSSVTIKSTNTNPISGAGTVVFSGVSFSDTGNGISTTTQTGRVFRPGITRSTKQPAFLAYATAAANNVTGDGTVYPVVCGTEAFDQNGDFSSTTFTAPVDGRYQLNTSVLCTQVGSGHTNGYTQLVTSNRSYTTEQCSPAAGRSSGNIFVFSGAVLADMDAADTAVNNLGISNSTLTVDISVSDANTFFSGYLVC